jgi:hypothetical protein
MAFVLPANWNPRYLGTIFLRLIVRKQIVYAAVERFVSAKPMSALGHKRTYAVQKAMSASPQ